MDDIEWLARTTMIRHDAGQDSRWQDPKMAILSDYSSHYVSVCTWVSVPRGVYYQLGHSVIDQPVLHAL